jgi:hypothetical protein
VEKNTVTFDGTWASGDTFNVYLTNTETLTQYRFGAGALSGLTPSFALTLNNKMYCALGTTLGFSALGDPVRFDDQATTNGEDADAPGNGFIVPGNNYGTPEVIQALANYQGKLAVINRNSVQIWSVAADPANNAKQQTLENLGTPAPKSVQSVGTLDVIMLSDSGVRSLRVRDSSNNAIVVDIGTPVDRDLQTALNSLTDTEKALCCGVVEPSANRYWLHVPAAGGGSGTIYVLSYFPTAGISAWSTYSPTVSIAGSQQTFNPQNFVVANGVVYARTDGALVRYGNPSIGSGYDNCGLTATTPWLDAKSPATRKQSVALDVSAVGTWAVSLGMDPSTGTMTAVYSKSSTTNASSFYDGQVPVSAHGTHFRLTAVESGTGAARLASAAFHYELLESN